ncbi:hypothetical protein FSOLCH5_010593 [Fusarium solani]
MDSLVVCSELSLALPQTGAEWVQKREPHCERCRTPESSDLSPGRHINRRFIMAGHGHHSFNGPPKPPVAHVPRIYRFTATALGAGMWFFLMYRAKKDGAVLLGLKHPWDH